MVKIEITDSYEAVAVLDAIVRFEVGEFPSDSSGRSTAERMVAYMKFMDTPTGKIILDLLQGDLGEVAMTIEVTDPFTVDPEMKWSTHDFEESVKIDLRSQVPADTFGTGKVTVPWPAPGKVIHMTESPCCQATIDASLADGVLTGFCSKCKQPVVRYNYKTGKEECLLIEVPLDGTEPEV